MEEARYKKLIAQIIFLALPTLAVVFFLLQQANVYFTILKNQELLHTVYFAAGLITALSFYLLRFKFVSTFIVLISLLFLIYKILSNTSIGEFDGFFISVQFLVFAVLFSIGWLCGWAFQRVSFFHIIISSVFLLCSIYLIARTGAFQFWTFIFLFSPIALYGVYIIFNTETIKNTIQFDNAFWKKIIKRFFAFCFLAVGVLAIVVLVLKKDIEHKLEEYAGIGKNSKNAVVQKDANGDVRMNDGMGMKASNKRDNELIFVAHIENNFEGTDLPNPLYLTAYHYTRFDSITETFERDSLMPSNDEFLPVPGELPIYKILQDSAKVINSLATKMRKQVNVEVYNVKMHKSMFVAPSTAYKIQTIAVDKNYQKEYKAAYKSTSMVSKLNSAYFIYNTNDPVIQSFQESRFALLRQSQTAAKMDSLFMNYYTQSPVSGAYKKIKLLADSISKNKTTTIDKVIGVRDYFTQRNGNGELVFKYSDNPGIPGLPSASKLLYFLTENHKGYCAYFAGATLMLLRNMGVPCRIAVGYLTVDRSDKNKGWYWYYGDQAHAWVEVYFPEYGWIDFDTTVGNEDAQESEKSDGTPPLIPEKAPVVLSGNIVNVDTLKKMLSLRLDNMVLKEKNIEADGKNIIVDISQAHIVKDTSNAALKDLQKGMHVLTISYNKTLNVINADNANQLLDKLSKPFKVDDVIIQDVKQGAKKQSNLLDKKEISNWKKWILFLLLALFLLCLLFFTIPFLVLAFYKWKSRNTTSSLVKSNYIYKYILLYTYLLGYNRKHATSAQYFAMLDNQVGTELSAFINLHLKLKYSNENLSSADENLISITLPNFIGIINTKHTFWQKCKAKLNAFACINYYFKKYNS